MWDLPRPGLEPVSPALAGRFSTAAPPGKPWISVSISFLILYSFFQKILVALNLIIFFLDAIKEYFFCVSLWILLPYMFWWFHCFIATMSLQITKHYAFRMSTSMTAINWTQYVKDHSFEENKYVLLGLCFFRITSTFTIWFILLPHSEKTSVSLPTS